MLICPSVGKHSRPRRSWGPYVTTGIALEAVAIFGFVYATDSDMSPPNLLVNNKVSTLAAPQTATPPVTQSALAGDDKPVIEEKKTEPAADKLTTDTGANKVEPAAKAKTRWRPGDLLRQLFAPKPKPASDQQSTRRVPIRRLRRIPMGRPATPNLVLPLNFFRLYE
jgi:hypothetical protein